MAPLRRVSPEQAEPEERSGAALAVGISPPWAALLRPVVSVRLEATGPEEGPVLPVSPEQMEEAVAR